MRRSLNKSLLFVLPAHHVTMTPSDALSHSKLCVTYATYSKDWIYGLIVAYALKNECYFTHDFIIIILF